TLRLDALASFTDSSGTSAGFTDGRWSTLTVHDGTVVAPLLTTLRGVDLTLDGAATMATTQITTVNGGGLVRGGTDRDFSGLTDATSAVIAVNRVRAKFPNLATLRFGSLALTSGATADVSTLADIDGASLFVSGGVTLALPGVTS